MSIERKTPFLQPNYKRTDAFKSFLNTQSGISLCSVRKFINYWTFYSVSYKSKREGQNLEKHPSFNINVSMFYEVISKV